MSTHASYREAYARFAETLPPAERAQRDAAFEVFVRDGFPDDGIERWHYTDLQRFGAQAVQLADAGSTIDVTPWQLDGCTMQTWHNGRALGALPDIQADAKLYTAHTGLAGLHRAFAQPGLRLLLDRNETLAQPLHALTLSSAEANGEMHHLAHTIRLARRAHATVVLEHAGIDGAERFITQSLGIELDEGAALTLIRVQDEASSTTQWLQTSVNVGRDAQLTIVNVDLGGGLIRNDWNVSLLNAGAHASLYGLFAADGKTHLDNQYEIDHTAPHGSSRETFRGLGFGKSKAILNGRVVVRPGAMKTDSEQRIASLMIDKGAEINAKPELEIYADDVKCAHGNSCGQLDDKAVFYLRSRGVPAATARALLTYSFASEVLAQIPHPALRRRIAQRIVTRLGAELDVDSLAEVTSA